MDYTLLQELDRIRSSKDSYLCGVDEVGRGSLAGPVVACACMMKKGDLLLGVQDSKKLTPKKREALFDLLTSQSISVGYGIVDHLTIDEINIRQATRLAMKKAILSVVSNADGIKPSLVVIDAETVDLDIPQCGIVHGDDLCYEISCASILAKVYRDRLMVELDTQYPGYDFKSNKGYGTKRHYEGIDHFGASEIHRQTFLRKYYEKLNH